MHKILILLTNCSHPPTNPSLKTGFDIRELAPMLNELRNHSPSHPGTLMESLVFATPEGGPAPISPSSAEAGQREQSIKDFMADSSTLDRIRNTESLDSLRPSDFMAVIIPGGHGPMFDLASNEKVGRFLQKCFYSQGAQRCLIVAVCHGVAALATMKKPGAGGEPFVKGRRLTCTSIQEENTQKWGKELPFQLEERMKELGALLTFVSPHKSNVIVDEAEAEEGRGRLITGQNTESCRGAVGKMIEIMESWKRI